uniref:Copia protein n=1 Tax=Tanacetum cinerariifolium TaxID=118510 RepID=A0A6L2K164_TANCI|nr:copia protein [Tanacetum cinerariifolium]
MAWQTDYCIMKEGMPIQSGRKSIPGMNSSEKEMERGNFPRLVYLYVFLINVFYDYRLVIPEEENKILKEISFKSAKSNTAAPVDDKEESFKQGRMIADMDEDVEVNLQETQAKAYNLDLQHSKKVLCMQDIDEEKPAEVEEVLKVVKAAKLFTEVVTNDEPTTTTVAQVPKSSAPRRRRGVVIQDLEETQVKKSERQNNEVMWYQALKRKPLTEAQARKNMMIYLKNMAGFKMNFFKGMTYSEIRPLFEKHYNSIQAFLEKEKEEEIAKKQRMDEEAEELKRHLQIVANDDDDVYTEATPLVSKVPVIDYQIHHENNKPYYKIIRADGTHKLFLSFITLLKNFDREDLETLWKLVKERFETTEPKNFSDDFLLNILKIMLEKPNIEANVWRDQKGGYGLAKVKSWKLFEFYGVYIITLTTTQMFLLVEKKYPLTYFTLEQMLNNVKLEVEEESKMSLELMWLVRRQLNERNKKNERGVVVRNKARLVAQGHQQEEGIDYDEVFAHVDRIKAIRIILAFASYMGFIVYQMDVKSAFLYGTIDEEVYVTQPPGFVDSKFPNKVYKVVKALYGLHQAPRAWYATLSTFLEKNDIIFGSTKKSWCDEFEELMKNRFQMSSMGELAFFLGLQVKQKEDGIFISQDKYVVKILKKFDFLSVKTASTPIETQKPLVKEEEAVDVDVSFYRRLILWQCKKQTNVANSTTEAKYVVAAHYCGQVLWIQNQLLDYGFNLINTKIYIDNESIICIVKNHVFHSKTKHIEIWHHFIRDAYEKKLIQVLKIYTDDNVADLLKKAFDVSSTMASVIICLATNQKITSLVNHQLRDMSHHQDIYDTPSLTKKVFSNMKRVGTGFFEVNTPLFENMLVPVVEEVGFSGVITPLFESMLVQAAEEVGQAQDDDGLKFQELMDLSTRLSNKVLDLESEVIDIKFSSTEKIAKLEDKVHKLEEENKILKEISFKSAKSDIAAPVDDKEESFKQGRMIADMDEDVEVNLQETQAKAYNLDLQHSKKVLRMQDIDEEELAEVEEVLEVVKAAKLFTEVVTNAEPTTTTAVAQEIAKKQRMDEEAEELKRHLQIVANDDDDVYTEATPLVSKNFDREDLETLWKLVKERFETTEPKNFSDEFLLNILKIMLEKPNIEANVWRDQKGRYGLAKVKSWKLFESYRVHIITLTTTQVFLLVKKKYPLTYFTLEKMLNNVKLEVEKESEMSLELLRLVKRQLNERYVPE